MKIVWAKIDSSSYKNTGIIFEIDNEVEEKKEKVKK